MLMPKKVKFRKVQRGTMKGLAKGGREILYGTYALQAVEPAWVSAAQIEAIRVTVNRRLKKVGKLFLRIFPDKPITKKPAETRMGKGKGAPEFWVSVVKRERIIIEIEGLPEEEAKKVLKLASYKLPLKTRFVKRQQAI
ncbi:50S ribosomal protein L16 [bacterium]|jgi:large subunit ribosomal protein L16|nr:50S ribosomal protein L16 [bacterium]MBT5015196.1 50S ribosomal protein L16 [bacterium]